MTDHFTETFSFTEEEVKRRLGLPMNKRAAMWQDHHTGELLVISGMTPDEYSKLDEGHDTE